MTLKASTLALLGLVTVGGSLLAWKLWPSPRPTPARVEPRAAAPDSAAQMVDAEPPPTSPVWGVLRPARDTSAEELVTKVAAFPHDLTAAEQNFVLRFLTDGLPTLSAAGQDAISLPRAHFHHVANQLMDSLLAQREPTRHLTPGLIAIWQNERLDAIIRDYALQHLTTWVAPPSGVRPRSESDEAHRQLILQTLFAAAKSADSHSAGTALLGLHHLELRMTESDRKAHPASSVPLADLRRMVVDVLSSESAPAAARATALQIATQRRWDSALPVARQLAANPAVPGFLRASAIAAVGRLGDAASDQTMLQALATSPDLHLQTASRASLALLENAAPR